MLTLIYESNISLIFDIISSTQITSWESSSPFSHNSVKNIPRKEDPETPEKHTSSISPISTTVESWKAPFNSIPENTKKISKNSARSSTNSEISIYLGNTERNFHGSSPNSTKISRRDIVLFTISIAASKMASLSTKKGTPNFGLKTTTNLKSQPGQNSVRRKKSKLSFSTFWPITLFSSKFSKYSTSMKLPTVIQKFTLNTTNPTFSNHSSMKRKNWNSSKKEWTSQWQMLFSFNNQTNSWFRILKNSTRNTL